MSSRSISNTRSSYRACSHGPAFHGASAFVREIHLERKFCADFGVSGRGGLYLKTSEMRKKGGGGEIGRMAGRNNVSVPHAYCKNAKVSLN